MLRAPVCRKPYVRQLGIGRTNTTISDIATNTINLGWEDIVINELYEQGSVK